MLRPTYKKKSPIPLVRELQLLAYSVVIVFVALALFTYHPHDSSWFYASTESGILHNKGGAVGAVTAAVLVYFLGIASFVLVGAAGFLVYCMAMGHSWRDEWERIGAVFLLVPVTAALSTRYAIGSWGAGGLIGRAVLALLDSFFDPLIATALLYTLFAVGLIVLVRMSWLSAVRGIVHGVSWCAIRITSKQRVWAPAYRVSKKIVYGAGFPVRCLVRLAEKVYTGATIGANDYTAFDFESDCVLDVFAWNGKNVADSVQSIVPQQKDDLPDSDRAVQLRLDTPTVCQGAVHVQPSATKVVHHTSVVGGKTDVCDVACKAYQLPNLEVFIGVPKERHDKQVRQELEERARLLEEKLERFGVLGKVTAIKYGPVVTLFEYQPDIDIKLSKILALEDDLALALQAVSIRILAPIPGRAVVGFEVANQRRLDVIFSALIRSPQYQKNKGVLPLILGEDTVGDFVVVDLAKMPHLLIAGSTGSGKSVALNAMLISLLCRLSPDDLKLILIDPKRLEFAGYADIAHLIFPVITDATQATLALRWVVKEMEERYEKLAACGVRTIADYREAQKTDPLPYIVVVIDELADLMMTAGRDCQDLITRIAQMARAAGIHLVVATQRPSVDVITGLIKANFPSRISFRVASKVDSRTILDCGGADKLLGRGDMLFLDAASASLRRVHGAYVSDKEIAAVIDHIRAERPASYRDLIAEVGADAGAGLAEGDDALYQDVRLFLATVDEVSISLLQRKFRIGYNRSARIIDMLEIQGLVLPADGGKTRKVIH